MGNQPTAQATAAALLGGPDTDWVATAAVEADRGHGRVERRTIRVAPADNSLFPGAAQAFRLRRDTGGLDGVWTRKEIVYGITSLPAHLAGPAQLNHYQRRHWVVEDRLHGVRDVTFGEDASQLRTGTAPRALAAFRKPGDQRPPPGRTRQHRPRPPRPPRPQRRLHRARNLTTAEPSRTGHLATTPGPWTGPFAAPRRRHMMFIRRTAYSRGRLG
jgi:hypothetical protein